MSVYAMPATKDLVTVDTQQHPHQFRVLHEIAEQTKPSALSEADSEGAEAERRFHEANPQLSRTRHVFDSLRKTEFSQLNEKDCTYLDYTGAAIAPRSIIDEHFTFLRTNVLGNPHSAHSPSVLSTQHETAAREAVLRFCNADPDTYTVIWTANSSAALRLVGQSYQFSNKGAFVYAPDCHNSVLGIAEHARQQGARVRGFKFGKNWTSSYDYDDLESVLEACSIRSPKCIPALFASSSTKAGKLLALPAQSNVSGVKHCTHRILSAAHDRGFDVFLDTAALAPTSRLDLTDIQPDFACLSFYKLFGYPTGIGCLLAKRRALARLRGTGFAGGTVRAVSAEPDHLSYLAYDPRQHQHWEDGTISFQQTAAVACGLAWLERIGMDNIRTHTATLIAWVICSLKALQWPNGRPLCFIPDVTDGEQGSTVSMLMLSASGRAVPHKLVEGKAAGAGLALRTGCFCNPGSAARLLDWYSAHHADDKRVTGRQAFKLPRDFLAFAEHYHTLGLVRVSVGVATTFQDVFRLVRFFKHEILSHPVEFEAQVERFIATAETPYSFC